jgi:hypothetical protein
VATAARRNRAAARSRPASCGLVYKPKRTPPESWRRRGDRALRACPNAPSNGFRPPR